MDGREHDVLPLPPQRPHHQDSLHAAEHHARGTGNHLMASRFEKAQAGDERAQAFFLAALHHQDAAILKFLEGKAEGSNRAACQLLRGYYLSLLLAVRAGNKRAGVALRRRILVQDQVVCTLLNELISRGDQVAQVILYGAWLKLCCWGDSSALKFFQRQLQSQQEGMLAFLSERAIWNKHIRRLLLFPYYQSLLSRAVGNEREMAIFQDQLRREDKTVQEFLVEQVEQKSDNAFHVLWEYYQPGIYFYVKAMVGSVEEAEDLTADIFFKASRSLSTRRDKKREMNLRPWLYTVANSVMIDSFREREVDTFTLPMDMDMDAVIDRFQPGPEDEICDREISKPLLEALQQLGNQERRCILMFYVYGLSTQEIATILGTEQRTVTSNLARGRSNLLDYYRQACDRLQDGKGHYLFKRLFGRGGTSKKHKEKKGNSGKKDRRKL